MAKNGRYRRVALLVAAGKTIRSAARQVGVRERTAYRWSAGEDFRKLVGELRTELTMRSLNVLTGGMAKAARKLNRLIDSPDGKLARLASRDVIKLQSQLRQQTELIERIEALEQDALKRQNGRKRP